MVVKRNRALYFAGVLVVIVLGLASRRFAGSLPWFIAKYAGDALWALMIFLGFGFILNRQSTNRVGILALLFCWGIETSQLYHALWIDNLRHTRLGDLVLGYEFLWSDLVCYAAGVTIGWLGEKLIAGRK